MGWIGKPLQHKSSDTIPKGKKRRITGEVQIHSAKAAGTPHTFQELPLPAFFVLWSGNITVGKQSISFFDALGTIAAACSRMRQIFTAPAQPLCLRDDQAHLNNQNG